MSIIFRPEFFTPTTTGAGSTATEDDAWDNNPATYGFCLASVFGDVNGSARIDYRWAGESTYTNSRRLLIFQHRMEVDIDSSAGTPLAVATLEYSWNDGVDWSILQQLTQSDTIGNQIREQIDSIFIPLGTPLGNIRARGYCATTGTSGTSVAFAQTRLKEIWVEVIRGHAAQAFI